MTKDLQAKVYLYFLPLYYIYAMLIDVVFDREGVIGIFINIFFLMMLVAFSFQNSHNKMFAYIYLWILFNIVLILFKSSDITFSFKNLCKNTIGLLCFPLAFHYISNKTQIIRFLKALISIMLLYILNLILANVFGLGKSYGGIDDEYAVRGGAALVSGSMPVVMALMMAPLILVVTRKKILFVLIWSTAITCVLFIFKRTNLASLFLGYFLLFIFYHICKNKFASKTRKINKQNFRKLGMLFLVSLSILVILFGNIIVAQFEIRSRKFGEDALEKEGRFIEWILVKKAILETDENSVFFLGKEPYNTSNNYGFVTGRNIHGDFSLILFSTGIIGTLLYWGMQLYIVFLLFPYGRRRYLRSDLDILLFAIYLASSAIWFIFALGETYLYVSLTAIYYMMHGMILRYFWNKHQRQERLIRKLTFTS